MKSIQLNRTLVQRGFCSFGLILVLALATTSSAAEWGSLKGRFVFDGKLDEPKAINVTKDAAFCGEHNLVDESIVVGEKGGLANVFVYLYLKRGKTTPIHPDLEKLSKEPVVLDNKGCRFEPHTVMLRTSQPLEILNSDAGVGHNTNAELLSNPGFNEMVTNDAPITKVFTKRESYPSPFKCNIHPWMNARVLIRDNPYMAVSDEKGCFEIKNLPAGKLGFVLWHESDAGLKKMAVGDGKTDKKGRIKLVIPAGKTLDLGEIKVKASVLGK